MSVFHTEIVNEETGVVRCCPLRVEIGTDNYTAQHNALIDWVHKHLPDWDDWNYSSI